MQPYFAACLSGRAWAHMLLKLGADDVTCAVQGRRQVEGKLPMGGSCAQLGCAQHASKTSCALCRGEEAC